MTNEERAEYGRKACVAGSPDDGLENPEDAVANILHYAHQQGVSVERMIEIAADNFEIERDGSEA